MPKKPRKHVSEHVQEARRLALLPVADQRAVIAMYRQLAKNPLATPACKADAKKRAAAYGRLLSPAPKVSGRKA